MGTFAKKPFGFMVAAVLVAPLFVACGSASTETSDNGSSGDGGERTIVVGELAILTGIKAAPYGIPFNQGAQMGFAEIAESGYLDGTGITFDHQSEDIATDVSAAVTQFNQFSQEGVDVFFGAADTPTTDAIRPLAKQTESLYITGSGGKPDEGSFVFALTDSVTPMVTFGEQLAANGEPRVVSIVDGDNDSFGIFADAFEEGLESGGGSVLQRATISMNDTDYSSVLTNLAEEQPDVVFISALSENSGNIIRQMRSQGGFEDVLAAGTVAWQDPVYTTGGDAVVGSVFPYVWAPGQEDTREFEEAYAAEFGDAPTTFSAIGYQSAWLLAVATRLVHEAGEPVNGATLQEVIPEAASSPDLAERGLIDEFSMQANGLSEYPGVLATFGEDGTITEISANEFASLVTE